MNKPGSNAGVLALSDDDRVIHEPARLAIMSLLFVVNTADFVFVMNQTNLTWGNLSAHLTKLEEAGYIEICKTFKRKRPNSMLRLTRLGREAFRHYAIKMKQAFQDFKD
jgi:DNA-binding transcriptional ArsR family regulator